MAAIINEQIRKFESKINPYLQKGPLVPIWTLWEQKTKLKREQLALGLVGVLILYLATGWCNDFLCNLIGFLYPAYASVLAVESKGSNDDTKWLVYWIVYSSFGFFEYVAYEFFTSLPMYCLIKCAFFIWLMMPGSNGGSNLLYSRFIRGFVVKSS